LLKRSGLILYFQTKILWAFPTQLYFISSSLNPPSFDRSNNIWWRIRIM
jgi:hypothetical protein